MNKLVGLFLMLILSVAIVSAATVTPQKGIDLRNMYNITNAIHIDANEICFGNDCRIAWANTTTADIQALGFNTTAELDNLYYPLSNPNGYINVSEVPIVTGLMYLNGSNSNITQLNFNINPLFNKTVGTLYWDVVDKTLALEGEQWTLQIGQEIYAIVYNDKGYTINNGMAVTQDGAIGDQPTVTYANSQDISTGIILGVATQPILSGQTGMITILGIVHDLNTSAWVPGTTLYSDSTGHLTDIKPIGYPMTIGQVVKQDEFDGSMFVRPRTAEIDPYWTAEKINYYNKSEVDILLNDKLNNSDQRYNETELINAVNTTNNIQGLGFNTTIELDGRYYSITNPNGYINITQIPPPYNDSGIYSAISAVNTTNNIQTLGFNTTLQLNGLYYSISNPNNYVNGTYTNLTYYLITNPSGYINGTYANNTYLIITDQRYNETTLINAVNTTSNIMSLGFYNTTYIDIIAARQSNRYAGFKTNPVWADNGDGSINFSTSNVVLYNNPDFTGFPTEYTLIGGRTGTAGVASLVDGANYMVGEYNAGNPRIQVITNRDLIHQSDYVPFLTIEKSGNELYVLDWDAMGNGMPERLNDRMVRTERYAVESGLVLGQGITNNTLTSTSGVIWYGVTRLQADSTDTSTSGLDIWHYNSNGTYVKDEMLNGSYYNDVWDNGTGLITLNNDTYANVWVYRNVMTLPEIDVIVGHGQYNSESEALLGQPPEILPSAITSNYILIGRVTFKKGELTGKVGNVNSISFGDTGVTNHNDLANIQGGGNGEFYHLTAAQYQSNKDRSLMWSQDPVYGVVALNGIANSQSAETITINTKNYNKTGTVSFISYNSTLGISIMHITGGNTNSVFQAYTINDASNVEWFEALDPSDSTTLILEGNASAFNGASWGYQQPPYVAINSDDQSDEKGITWDSNGLWKWALMVPHNVNDDRICFQSSQNPLSEVMCIFSDGHVTINGNLTANINASNIMNSPWLPIIDQRYNDTILINAVNTTNNIQGLGFNTTAQLNNLYYSSSNPLSFVNQSFADNRYVNVDGDNMTGNLNMDNNSVTFGTNKSIYTKEGELYIDSNVTEFKYSPTNSIYIGANGFNKKLGSVYQFGFLDNATYQQTTWGNSQTTIAYFDVYGSGGEIAFNTLSANKGPISFSNAGIFPNTDMSSPIGNSTRRWKSLTVQDINLNGTINGYNTTAQLNTLYYLITNPNGYINSSGIVTAVGNWTADKPNYLNSTADATQDNQLMQTFNTTGNIQSLGFNTTAQLTPLYNNLYNDTVLANQKALPGNCPAGQLVQNTTTGGVQCIAAGTGTVSSITAGTGLTGGVISTSGTIAVNTTYLSTLYYDIANSKGYLNATGVVSAVGNWSADKPNYNNQSVDNATFVPYTGANANTDLGSKNLTTTGTINSRGTYSEMLNNTAAGTLTMTTQNVWYNVSGLALGHTTPGFTIISGYRLNVSETGTYMIGYAISGAINNNDNAEFQITVNGVGQEGTQVLRFSNAIPGQISDTYIDNLNAGDLVVLQIRDQTRNGAVMTYQNREVSIVKVGN
jgi:hypothetical protein